MPGFIDNVGDLSGANVAAQPRVTTITVQTTAVKIVQSDPKRVFLLISGNSSQAHTIANDASVAQNQGIVLPTSDPWIIFTQAEHGPVVTLEWWAICAAVGANTMGILTVSLSDWPSETGENLIQETDRGKFRGLFSRSTQRPGRVKLYGDSWGKRQEKAIASISHFLNTGVDF
jgi:hypothetical protein